MESRGGHSSGGVVPTTGKLTLSERLAEKKASFMSQSMDSGIKGLNARPPSGTRPSTGHRRDGGGARPASSRGGGGYGGGANMNAKPLALTCYLCGTQHFRQSLFIHISACQKKWIMVEEAKLPRERRPLPPPPPELTEDLPTTTAGIERFNADMYTYWDRVSCVVCSICTRSFRPDAFEKHVKVCTSDSPGGPLGMPKGVISGRPPVSKQGRGFSPPGIKGGDGAGPSGARPNSSRPPGGGSRGGPGPGGGPNMNSKPRAFSCYLCGTSHFRQSLFIHIAQCQKKWIMVEEAKLPRERRPLPPPPPELTEDLPTDPDGIDRFNANMFTYWDRVSLMVCRICTRSFRPEAYEKHAKVCTADNPGGPLGLPKGVTPAAAKAAAAASGGGGPGGGPNMYAKPRALACYLCGGQFFSQSLLIHIPQCYEKWLMVQDQRDPRERREPPPPPAELDQPLPTRPAEIDAFNQRMSDIFNGFSLVKCAHCGRTMQPEALVRHQKACTSANPMKSASGPGASTGGRGAGSQPSPSRSPHAGSPGLPPSPASGPPLRSDAGTSEQPEEDGVEMDECANCGRRMRAEALAKHNKVCTPDKPMKSVKRSSASPSAAPAAADSGTAPRPPAADSGTPPRPPAACPGLPIAPSPPPLPRPLGAGARRPTHPGDISEAAPGSLQPGVNRTPSPAASPADAAHSSSTTVGHSPSLGSECPPSQVTPSNRSECPPSQVTPSNRSSYLDGFTGDGEGPQEQQGERVQCGSCGRRFLSEAFEKHSRICAKVFASKRKAFDSSKARLSGTEAAEASREPAGGRKASAPATKPAAAAAVKSGSSEAVPKWKAQSESLRAAMENMKQVKVAMARGEPLPPPVPSAPDPSFIQCPHCGRRFNAHAAERHIPSCANTVSKPNFLKRGTGGSGAGAPQSKPLPKY